MSLFDYVTFAFTMFAFGFMVWNAKRTVKFAFRAGYHRGRLSMMLGEESMPLNATDKEWKEMADSILEPAQWEKIRDHLKESASK